MLTILNRLFPEDVSQIIINIIKNEYIKNLCINKCFVMEFMMENLINKYNFDTYYNIVYDTSNIKQIYDLHNFVIKNNNSMLNTIEDIINNYYKILKHHNNYQLNWVKKIVEKYIIT